MPCFTPLAGVRSFKPNQNGNYPVIIIPKAKQKLHEAYIPTKCGQCIGCRIDRTREWAVRCVHETQSHETACFLTLTYNQDNLPWDGSLVKSHLQNFFKRLRKEHPTKRIRYYSCGEYGDQLSRPHYHVCLFGYDFPDRELRTQFRGNKTYTSPELTKLWKNGYHSIGEMNWQTAAYTARYVMKKINGKNQKDAYWRPHPYMSDMDINLLPEFTLMSLKPGIGAQWFEDYQSDIYPSDEIIHNGSRFKVPSYYDQLMKRKDPDYIENLKEARRLKAVEHAHNNTPERLKVRHKTQLIKADRLKRHYEND